MKASILAIGTELTTGQIINKNAANLSEKLTGFGIQTPLHLTVPDDRKLILQSLHYVEPLSDLIFITGGLGPTSDDFTREVVAEWLQKPLQFDEKSWTHITARLSSRGFQVREMQKQQCYYPEGAVVLENKEGTANAFQFKKGTQTVFVLPGPPREIESIWQDHLKNWLQVATQQINKRVTKAWDTLAVGESDVAYMVEEVLAQFPKSNELEIGYRVHLPYVEVKISFDENKSAVFHEALYQVNEKLKAITITRNFADIAAQVIQKISDIDFTFYDFLTSGYLHTRLSSHLKNLKQWSFKQSKSEDRAADFFIDEDQFFALLPYPLKPHSCLVLFSIHSKKYQKIIEAPMTSSLMGERRLQYFSEMGLVELAKALNSL